MKQNPDRSHPTHKEYQLSRFHHLPLFVKSPSKMFSLECILQPLQDLMPHHQHLTFQPTNQTYRNFA